MPRHQDFLDALTAAGIPVDGVSGNGPNCRIDFRAGATAAQQSQANAARASFDWTAKVPMTEAALTAKLRQLDPPTLNQLMCSVAARMLLAAGMPEQFGTIPAYSAVPVPTPANAAP